MAKNLKPLTILVTKHLEGCPEVQALKANGHNVVIMSEDLESFDIIFGPKCWRMVDGLEKLITVAITAARNVKYKRVKKDKDDEDMD